MKKGFTLIELLVVIVIIGILAALLMVNFVEVRKRSRDGQRKADLKQIQAALEFYRSDQGSYPTSAIGIKNCSDGVAFGNNGCTSIYMKKVPSDPLNTGSFIYRYSSDGSTYFLNACLENVNDPQKDSPSSLSPCDTSGTDNWSLTLVNP